LREIANRYSILQMDINTFPIYHLFCKCYRLFYGTHFAFLNFILLSFYLLSFFYVRYSPKFPKCAIKKDDGLKFYFILLLLIAFRYGFYVLSFAYISIVAS
jgi:hypothetical protein